MRSEQKMKPRVESTNLFDKESRRLSRKYSSLRAEIDYLRDQLQSGERPGNRLVRIGLNAFKVRLPNRSAQRGKSGGFRVIYQEKSGTLVLLLIIYSKTERADIPNEVIRRLILSLD